MKLSNSGKLALALAAGTVVGVTIGVLVTQNREEKPLAKRSFGGKLEFIKDKGFDALHNLRETLDKLDEIATTLKSHNHEPAEQAAH